MKKTLSEVGGYKLDNPFVGKEPIKWTFMRRANLMYRKIRLTVSKAPLLNRLFPLTQWQQIFWGDDKFQFSHMPNSPKDSIDDEAKTGSPLSFSIDCIAVTELVPKEDISLIEQGIKRFCDKQCAEGVFDSPLHKTEHFECFSAGFGFTHLCSKLVKPESNLYQYITQIHFRIVNLSDSFCGLVVHLFLNDKLKAQIENFAISDVKEQSELTGFDQRKWYQFQKLAYGEFSGATHKLNLLNSILDDIVWNICHSLYAYIPCLFFFGQHNIPPYLSSVLTNISDTSNEDFWYSVGISPAFCDYCNDCSAYIAWRNNYQPFFVWRKNDKNQSTAYHLTDTLCYYMIPSAVDDFVRLKLRKYSTEITKLKRKSVRHWLKLKVQINTEMFHAIRFLKEYKNIFSDSEFSLFQRVNYDHPLILSFFQGIENTCANTRKLYNDISEIFQSNIDYRNAKSNYNTQRAVLIISVISLLVALVALIVSILVNKQVLLCLFKILIHN